MENVDTQNIEIQLLLEAIFLQYGYDFREYSRASVKRRILHRLGLSGLNTLAEMQYRVLYDDTFFKQLLLDLSINVTEMFRDPSFYQALRGEVIPLLRTYPFIKIWHAGCATGEEAYSMAILLKEEGLYERSQIYATDFNDVVLRKAKDGIFPVDRIREYTRNYQLSGGKNAFIDYYIGGKNAIIMDSSLKKNIMFANHNLETDGVFGEIHLILCRNVLIYFNKTLQDRVYKLFHDSLCRHGVLCLGSKESLQFSNYGSHFEAFVRDEKIYKRNH